MAEPPMEARIARLESDVAHLCADVADIKIDVRSVRDKVDALGIRLDQKIDARFDALRGELTSLKAWAFGLYVALAAGMFATMARGFGWI